MFLLFRRCGLDGFFLFRAPDAAFGGILVGTLIGILVGIRVGGLFCGFGVVAAPCRYAACVAMGCACRADVAPVQDKPVVRHGEQVVRDVTEIEDALTKGIDLSQLEIFFAVLEKMMDNLSE